MSFKYLKFYEDHISVGTPNSKGEVLVKCIFHDDESPSLSINLGTGLFKCHTPSCEGSSGGNIYTFYMLSHKEDNLTYDMAVEKVNEEYFFKATHRDKPKKIKSKFPITVDEIKEKHTALLNKSSVLKVLTEEFLWSIDIINKFSIGFDGERIWIPITEYGKVVNVRKYSRKPTDGNKVISIAGHGEARLWPLEALDMENVYIFEGEKDCILANSLGINGMTVTGGAGTFEVDWVKAFENRNVIICYDIDEAGRKGAAIVAKYLLRAAKQVKVVALPIDTPPNGDFTDYITQGRTKEDFMALAESTEPVAPINDNRVPDTVKEMPISAAVERKLFYRRIKSKIRVVSKMETPSLLPGVLNFTCTRAAGNMCYKCDNHGTGSAVVKLDETSTTTLRLLTTSVKESKGLYKEIFKVPMRCTCYQVLETDHQYVEDILSSPIVDELNKRNLFRQRFEEHQMYILNTALDVNTDYDIESVMYEHPEDRKIVHLVYKIAPCLSTLDNACLGEKELEALKEFQYEEDTTETRRDTPRHIEQRNENTGPSEHSPSV